MPQKHMKAGYLIRVGHVNIGEFENRVVNYAKGVGDLSRSIAYWVPSGEDAGAGRLSRAMALSAREWVRESLLGIDRSRKYVGPSFAPLSDKYAKWKAKAFPGKPIMSLTGRSAAQLAVIEKKGSGFVVGFRDRGDKVQDVKVYSNPLKYNVKRWKSIGMYMAANEFGIGPVGHARPIIQGSFAGWVQKMFPEWSELFRKYLTDHDWFKGGSGFSLSSSGGAGSPVDEAGRAAKLADGLEKAADTLERGKAGLPRQAKSDMDKGIKDLSSKWLKGV